MLRIVDMSDSNRYLPHVADALPLSYDPLNLFNVSFLARKDGGE